MVVLKMHCLMLPEEEEILKYPMMKNHGLSILHVKSRQTLAIRQKPGHMSD